MFNILKKVEQKREKRDKLIQLHMEAFNRACKLMGYSVRVEMYHAFVTDKEGNRILMPLVVLMKKCRVYINELLDYKFDATEEEMVEAKNIKLLLDIAL